MTPGHHALSHQVSKSYNAARYLETPHETSSGTDITSSVAAKQLRKFDSGLKIYVADPQADDAKLHTAIAEFELADLAGDNIIPPGAVRIKGEPTDPSSFWSHKSRLTLANLQRRSGHRVPAISVATVATYDTAAAVTALSPQSHVRAIARSASGAAHRSAAPLNSSAILK